MATDFNYNNKTIAASGPFKPTGKDMPVDARTRVETYADIASIPNPHIGLKITVKVDETNNNKMTDYIVKSLKANSMGNPDSVINEVVRYVDYLGASSGGSMDLSGYATKDELNTKANVSDIPTNTSELNNDSGFLTSIPSEYVTETEMNEAIANVSSGGSVSQEDINTAVNNYLTEHPVTGGATAEQAAQIEANKTAIGDSNSGLTKEINDIKNTELGNLNAAIQTLEALVGVDETVGDKTELPSGDANVIASINRIDSKTLSANNILISPDNSRFKLIVDNSGNLSTEKISEELEVASIKLNKETSSLKVGETETLTYTLSPEGATSTVTWSTDRDSVATVNNGEVQGISAGIAIITATTSNNKTDSCTFTITDNTVVTDPDNLFTESCLNYTVKGTENGRTGYYKNPSSDGTIISYAFDSSKGYTIKATLYDYEASGGWMYMNAYSNAKALSQVATGTSVDNGDNSYTYTINAAVGILSSDSLVIIKSATDSILIYDISIKES